MRKKHPRPAEGTEPREGAEGRLPQGSGPQAKASKVDHRQPELEGLGQEPPPANEGGGDQPVKNSRSRRRRQRRNEAKRLAAANAAGRGPEGETAGEGGNLPGGPLAPPPQPKAKGGHGHAAGAEPKDHQGHKGPKPRAKPSGPRDGQGKEGQPKYGAQGKQGRTDKPKAEKRPPRTYHEDRGARGEAWEEREPRPTRRRSAEPKAERSTYQESILPPPEVIAALEGGNYQPPSQRRILGRGKAVPSVRVLEKLSPSPESLAVLSALEGAIEEASPLQAKHRAGLKGDIRGLWEELTSERESRSADYLGTPPALSAYLRYFLPWNVFRLSSIFSNADFCLPDKAVVVDIGSGPLTLPIALYASRPELRDVPLTIYCMDRVERILEAGLAIFEILCMRTEGRLPPWKIVLKKEGFGAPLPEKAHLLTAANVFNEFFWKEKGSLGERALDTARSLLSYLKENGSLFIMEPGDPRSGAFITSLRAALAANGATPLGPCPHALSCPMPGIYRHLLPPEETRVAKGDPNVAPSRYVLPPVIMPKKRDKFPWCHFGVDTDRAPEWLQAMSAEAGLPKERAVLSYLWAARGVAIRLPMGGIPDPVHASEKEKRAKAGRGILVRVVSEPFALSDGSTGQYACSNLGYSLLKRPRGDDAFEPGDLLEVAASPMQRNDEKSGAIILPT